MGEVRVFAEEHVCAAADLYLRSMRGQHRTAPLSLQNYFREIFFLNPWVTPEIQPLVYLEKGKLVGFLGVIPGSMQFRGRSIRSAVASQLMVERIDYRGPAALELIRHLLRGPQDLTFTDGAAEGAAKLWTAAGARVARLYSFNWIRVLRPCQTARGLLSRLGLPLLSQVSGLVAPAADYLLSKAPLGFQRPTSRCSVKPVSAEELIQYMDEFRGRESLRPSHVLPEFAWLMSQAASASKNGQLRMMTAHGPDGECFGSFVYYAKQRAAAYVLQIGWRRRDNFPEVLRALFQDAWDQGSSAVKGQAIPQFLTILSEEMCLFRQLDSSVLGYSPNPDIMNALLTGDTTISRLDGECWLRFSSEPWT